jgi:thiosulfate/3-mercaptopyruvate sulfurtransferase
VTADELARLLEEGSVTLLDVRTRAEYEGESGYPCDPRQGHIPGAVNVEVDELQAAGPDVAALLAGRGVDASRPIVAYCHSGSRSEIAAALLRAAGLEAVNYAGSWHEWSRRPA